MKVQEVIDYIENLDDFVDKDLTRDTVLYGNVNTEVKKVGVCWIVSNDVIQQAIDNHVNLIITHENMFYKEGTCLNASLRISRRQKMELLEKFNICVYRTHDLWDRLPNLGIADSFVSLLGFKHDQRDKKSFYTKCYVDGLSLEETAAVIADKLSVYGQSAVETFGDRSRVIHTIAAGTGAITNVFEMIHMDCDCYILCDDGITNYSDLLYCADNHICAIIVHHSTVETAGIRNAVQVLANGLGLKAVVFNESFAFETVHSKKAGN